MISLNILRELVVGNGIHSGVPVFVYKIRDGLRLCLLTDLLIVGMNRWSYDHMTLAYVRRNYPQASEWHIAVLYHSMGNSPNCLDTNDTKMT